MLELLAPAGNMECAEAAIYNGANAIYVGLGNFSARQSAENFDSAAFSALIKKAHSFGVKVYVAMNTIVKNEELSSFVQTLLFAWNHGADAIILQDIFLGKYIHEQYPNILLHLSTQAGVCNLEGAKIAKEYGFSRVILARETPLSEIKKIAQFIETEVFVQGALCTAFSGQCYFSSFAGGNSGNRGRCKQPCRKLYAYDRNGNEEKNYALSLSDLCVGEDIQKLIDIGVVSFKIEGRMRRAEYVAAAVRYYNGILDGAGDLNERLSDLKRTYNRGNYTKGLAFGQDKRFLSTAIQGHIGEKVGVVKVVNGKFLVESRFKPQSGDGFKILRDGKEIGGAIFVKQEGKCFVISSKIRLKNGDGVFVTTDTAVNQRLLFKNKRICLSVSLRFVEGELPVAECDGVRFEGETPLQSAQSRPLSIEELSSCFLKIDTYPFEISLKEIELNGSIFIPKSELNAFRRAFYSAVWVFLSKTDNQVCDYASFIIPSFKGENEKTAVIATDFEGVNTDIAIYKANDYSSPLPESFKKGNFEKYLYYPAFATEKDLQALAEKLEETQIDGVYAENFGGLTFAKEKGVALFAGTGFNLINSISVDILLKESCVRYYAISKEGNAEELSSMVSDKAFVLSSGNIKVMELCYCPFGKFCNTCDKKQVYRLTDENGRIFLVRRYLAADGSCRFEVYNCVDLVGLGVNGAGKLLDLSLLKDKEEAILAKDNEGMQKKTYVAYTSGHYKRGVL